MSSFDVDVTLVKNPNAEERIFWFWFFMVHKSNTAKVILICACMVCSFNFAGVRLRFTKTFNDKILSFTQMKLYYLMPKMNIS